MKHKLIWAAIFGLFIALSTGFIQTSEQPMYAPSEGSHYTWAEEGFGFPAQILEVHYMYAVPVKVPWWEFTVQFFNPIGLAFNWAFYSLILMLLFRGWHDLKRYSESVEGLRATSKLLFLASFVYIYLSLLSADVFSFFLLLSAWAALMLGSMALACEANAKDPNYLPTYLRTQCDSVNDSWATLHAKELAEE